MRGGSRTRLLAGCLLAMATLGHADASDPCDPALVRLADRHSQAYRLRGDRCEGTFAKPVAGSSLLSLVSFTASFAEFDPNLTSWLPISWPTPGPGQVRIRAQSQEPELHYRMDTVRPPTPAAYGWPTDVLKSLHLQKKRIGVVAWTTMSLGGLEHKVYVPLRIGAEQEAQGERKYTVVLVPHAELAEVTISVVALSPDGRAIQPPVEPPTDLRLGSYLPGRSFVATIRVPTRAGMYRLEVIPATRQRTLGTTDVVFFSAGPS